jgi:hypothetical protein
VKKKTFMATIIMAAFLISLIAGIQSDKVVKANPVPWQLAPNQDKPTLTIETPQNYTTYNATSVFLNFTATEPDSWNTRYMGVVPFVGEMFSANVYLDGILFANYGYSGSVFVLLNQSASGLNQLAPGAHSLNVTVLSYTYYRGPDYNNTHIVSSINSSSGPVYEYPIVVSGIVLFTVAWGTSPSPSATPTTTSSLSSIPTPIASMNLPEPTPSPTQHPTIEPNPSTYNTQADYRTPIIVAFLLAAVVTVDFLVYFAMKKRVK